MSVNEQDTKPSVEALLSLLQLDVDAIQAYAQAISAIDIPEIRDRLDQFRQDHERHVEDLSEAIRELGGEPPRPEPGLKGQILEGYTAARAAMGIAGALRAMKSNELLTNARYEAALATDFPADVKRVIKRNREDERRHLAYIEAALEDRLWELDASPGMHGRLTADLGQLIPMALGGGLVVYAIAKPSAASVIGAVIGAGLVYASMQSGVDPGGLVKNLAPPRRTASRNGTARRRGPSQAARKTRAA